VQLRCAASAPCSAALLIYQCAAHNADVALCIGGQGASFYPFSHGIDMGTQIMTCSKHHFLQQKRCQSCLRPCGHVRVASSAPGIGTVGAPLLWPPRCVRSLPSQGCVDGKELHLHPCCLKVAHPVEHCLPCILSAAHPAEQSTMPDGRGANTCNSASALGFNADQFLFELPSTCLKSRAPCTNLRW
jgi:hypothetical protein